MVTMENILEELVGQIQDEFDQEKPLLIRTGVHSWEMAGALPLHELAHLVQEPLQEEGITTVSGWVTHRQGGFPKAGDVLTLGGFELRVEEIDGMRVAKLKLTRLPTSAGDAKSTPPQVRQHQAPRQAKTATVTLADSLNTAPPQR